MATNEEFELVVENLRPLLVWRAASVVKSLADPEDVVQQALLECYTNLDKFDGNKAQISTWITTTVDRRALDMATRTVVAPAPKEDEDGETQEDEASYEMPYELVSDLKKALLKLPAFKREVLLAVHVEGYGIYEYATKRGVSFGTVRCALEGALRSMREYLADYEEEYASPVVAEVA